MNLVAFIARLLSKNQDSIPLQILVGHHYSMGGSHKLALKQYFNALSAAPDDPLINLCIGKYS